MNFFHRAASDLPLMLASFFMLADYEVSRSMIVFAILVALVAGAWLLAMVALSGAWKRLAAYLPREVWIAVIVGVEVTAICCLLLVLNRHPVPAGPVTSEVVRPVPQGAEISKPAQPTNKQTSTGVKKDQGVTKPQTAAAGQAPITSRPVPVESVKALPPKAPPEKQLPQRQLQSTGSEVASRLPSHVPPMDRPRTEARSQKRSSGPAIQPLQAKPVRQAVPTPEVPLKQASVSVHRIKPLSDSQARQLCGAVGLYANTDVYIRWSPGANAAQLASQLSKVMDCARVTVTFASEQPGMEGRGVRVGTHADEGQTSDRLRPFADAIAAALREQGFSVTEVAGSNIPANQTAIFIGSD